MEAVADVAVQARRAPGCLDFVQAADPVEPARINIDERWASDEDLERLRTSDTPGDEPDLHPGLSASTATRSNARPPRRATLPRSGPHTASSGEVARPQGLSGT